MNVEVNCLLSEIIQCTSNNIGLIRKRCLCLLMKQNFDEAKQCLLDEIIKKDYHD